MGFSFFRTETHIDFVGKRRFAYGISALLLILGLCSIFISGIRYGVDFAGGAAIQIRFEQQLGDETIKQAFDELNLPGLSVQQYGNNGHDYLIRFSESKTLANEEIRGTVVHRLQDAFPDNPAVIERFETVGPKVGADLRNAALEAMFYALLLITVYISGRFEHRWMTAAVMTVALGLGMYGMGMVGLDMAWRVLGCLIITLLVCAKLRLNFALGAILSLLHDVLLTIGLLTFLGKEFDLNIIAALLTLVGYSLNDTIIVYDRIRENLKNQPHDAPAPLQNIINRSINQTLSRTMMTSGTTLAACLSLFFLGGGVIHDFAFTMLIGIVVGTFSSIFVAAPILLLLGDTHHYMKPFITNETQTEIIGEHGVV